MVERQAFKREEEVMMKDGEELCIKPSQQTVLETTVQKLKEKKIFKAPFQERKTGKWEAKVG